MCSADACRRRGDRPCGVRRWLVRALAPTESPGGPPASTQAPPPNADTSKSRSWTSTSSRTSRRSTGVIAPRPACAQRRWPVLTVLALPAQLPAPRYKCPESRALVPAGCAAPLACAKGSRTRPARALVRADSAHPANVPVGEPLDTAALKGGSASCLPHCLSFFWCPPLLRLDTRTGSNLSSRLDPLLETYQTWEGFRRGCCGSLRVLSSSLCSTMC